jgi:hypothetical protein
MSACVYFVFVIGLAEDRDQWRALVNTAMTFGFHKILGSA